MSARGGGGGSGFSLFASPQNKSPNSAQIKVEIERFESVHPTIYTVSLKKTERRATVKQPNSHN